MTQNPHFVPASLGLEHALLSLGQLVTGRPDAVDDAPIPAPGVGANMAAAFENETFALRDYCWCDGRVHPETVSEDDEEAWEAAMERSGGTSTGCPPNFIHHASGITATWYKHLGRDLRASREISVDELGHILRDCAASLEYRPATERYYVEVFTAGGEHRSTETLAPDLASALAQALAAHTDAVEVNAWHASR